MSNIEELSSSNKSDEKHNNITNPPDPTFLVTRFLGWLIKRGGIQELSLCKKKWENEGLDIEKIIKDLSPQYLRKYRSRGKKVVRLENKPWATQWMRHYSREIPHHRHEKKLEKIVSVTENKTKV